MSLEPFGYFWLMWTLTAVWQRHVFRLDAINFLDYTSNTGRKRNACKCGQIWTTYFWA